MKKYVLHTKGKEACYDLTVKVPRPTKVRLVVVSTFNRDIIYFDRWQTVKSVSDFEIRLPQTNKRGDQTVELMVMAEGSFEVVSLKQKRLPTYAPCLNASKNTKRFVRFAQAFVERIHELPVGTYKSLNGEFQIDLYDIIRDNPITPARIENNTGRMEVSKKAFEKMTVPMMMAILCHEYSHFYLNENIKDEIEADLNGLKLYMGMGYPIIESHKSFLRVFAKADTPQNRERYDYIFAFVKNFDKVKYKVCL